MHHSESIGGCSMTINIYSEYRDEDGNLIDGRTKLFVSADNVDENGNFQNFQSGLLASPITSGFFYIIDSWILHQIHKLKIVGGMLTVKDGETLQERIKTPEEVRMEELEKEIQMLKARQNIQPAYNEESSQLININTADYDALLTLTGIGETKANAIIDYRKKQGNFKDPEDIMQVPGIGPSLYDGLKNEITV